MISDSLLVGLGIGLALGAIGCVGSLIVGASLGAMLASKQWNPIRPSPVHDGEFRDAAGRVLDPGMEYAPVYSGTARCLACGGTGTYTIAAEDDPVGMTCPRCGEDAVFDVELIDEIDAMDPERN